jgi:hypothetical protein
MSAQKFGTGLLNRQDTTEMLRMLGDDYQAIPCILFQQDLLHSILKTLLTITHKFDDHICDQRLTTNSHLKSNV